MKLFELGTTTWMRVSIMAAIVTLHALGQDTMKVIITDIPHAGKGGESEMERIAGKVSHIKGKDFRIVLYTLAQGKWWVQPYADSPYTDLDQNGNWHSQTHLGSDYAVLVVKPTFQAPPTIRDLTQLGDGVIVMTKAEGKR